MSLVVITEFMDAGSVARLSTKFEVHWDDTLGESRSDLMQAITGASALIVRNKTQVDRQLLDAAPNIKVVGRLGVGLDNIDLAACAARGIAVCPATGANAPSVAEYVIGAAFVLVRQAFLSSHRLTAGEWPRGELSAGGELAGRVMGLVGFGGIGQDVARRAIALGMNTIAFDPLLPGDHADWAQTKPATLEHVIATADVISLHVPLTDETRGMINAAAIADMKPGAVVINTARGGIIDDSALAGALRSGALGGAAIDVFENEPPGPAAMENFAGLSNIILTPHIAGLTAEANVRVSELTVTNVINELESHT